MSALDICHERCERLEVRIKQLKAENERLNAFMKCVIEDLETHLTLIDDEIEQRNINRFIVDIKQNLSKPMINIIVDNELPNGIVELRHPKTNKLILRVVSLQGQKEVDEEKGERTK